MDIVKHNKSAWINYVDKKDRWTIPVIEEELEKYNERFKTIEYKYRNQNHEYFSCHKK